MHRPQGRSQSGRGGHFGQVVGMKCRQFFGRIILDTLEDLLAKTPLPRHLPWSDVEGEDDFGSLPTTLSPQIVSPLANRFL